jgi:subtilase family serine protease
VLLLLVWFGWSAERARAEQKYELPGAVSRWATGSRLIGRADPHERLGMSITLGVRHQDELDALLAAQQQPGSPQYHRWLSPQEFAARFAPSVPEYEALAQWLEREGFAVHRWENRLRLDFSGSVARVESTFGVRMNYYQRASRIHIANENAPLLPIQFADSVEFIRLNTFPLAEPLVQVAVSGGLVDTMAPRDLQLAYNVLPVLGRGIDGSGQIIAVVARSDYNDSDVSSFQQKFGAGLPLPTKVFPAEDPGVGAPNTVCSTAQYPKPSQRQQCIQGEEGEVLLDVEWANALAPGATVLVDIAGPGVGEDADIDESLLDIVNHHPEAKMISISFGDCESQDTSDHRLFAPMYAQAAAQGQTVFVATGDNGADDCGEGSGASVNVLATDPNVTAVGGTALNAGFDGNGNATGYFGETVWNDAYGASGGGVSVLVGKPAYQVAPGVPAGGMRAVPDVALLASPATSGYVIVITLPGEVQQVMIVGGTSVATPNWAGIVALLNQAGPVEGSGALNTRLYALAQRQYAPGGSGPFHDIVAGNNSYDHVTGFSAGVGYDLCTGLGTPDVDLLVRAFAALNTPTPTPTSAPTLTNTPTVTPVATITRAPTQTVPPTSTPRPCAGDCNGDGVVTIDEIVTGVNIALGATPLSQCLSLDANGDGLVTVDELLRAVSDALNGC